MISCKDLESVYFLYQTEDAPKGVSIDVSVCKMCLSAQNPSFLFIYRCFVNR